MSSAAVVTGTSRVKIMLAQIRLHSAEIFTQHAKCFEISGSYYKSKSC